MIIEPSFPVLMPGYSSEKNIYALQCLLIYHGISVSLTGKYDSGTESAVLLFQRNNGLDTDGRAGPLTLQKLVDGIYVSEGVSNYTARAAQYLLSKFTEVTITGAFNSASGTALYVFQTVMGIERDRVVGPISWKYLFGYYFFPRTGCDTADTITSTKLNLLKDNGFTYVGKYLPGSVYPMSKSERELITNGGLSIYSLWEPENSNWNGYFVIGQGTKDAKNAIAGAKLIGQPYGTPIYFTIDYDPATDIVNSVIKRYLTEIFDEFSASGFQYQLGLYGSGLVLNTFQNMFPYRMLAAAVGWNGTAAYAEYCIQQFPQTSINNSTTSLNIDVNYSNAVAGVWK